MTHDDIAKLRVEYETVGLRRSDLDQDPFVQFDAWFESALTAGVPQANAFVLATVDADGSPSARAVLMKDLTSEGLVFYTNRASRKGQHLEVNPRVAGCFVWQELHRQVRVEGTVGEVDDETSDAYFRSRPPGSRWAAAASDQSEVVPDRAFLEQRWKSLVDQYPTGDVPRPPNWGGYVIRPDLFEFWQGRPDRFHDRFRYSAGPTGWTVDRLAP